MAGNAPFRASNAPALTPGTAAGTLPAMLTRIRRAAKAFATAPQPITAPPSINEPGWLINQIAAIAPENYSRSAALEFPAVGAAVRAVSRELARMKLRVESREPDAWSEVDYRDPEARIVAESWDDFRSKSKSVSLIVRGMMLDGFCAVWVERTPQIQRLRVLDPDLTTRSGLGAAIRYKYSGFDAPTDLERSDLLWFEYEPDFGDDNPVPPLYRVWPSFRLAIAAARFASRYFDSGATGNVVYQSRDEHGPDAAQVSDDFHRVEDMMRAAGRRSMALPGMYEAKQLSGNAREADVVNLLVYGIQDVARVFGVPPIALADLSRGTYANYAQSLRYMARFTLTSLADAISEEVSRMLWPSGLRRARLDVGDIGDESLADKTVRLREAVAIGAMSQNDMREALGLPRLGPEDEGYTPDMDAYVRNPTFPIPETLGFDPNGEDLGDAP